MALVAVIDEEPLIRLVLQLALGDKGHEVETLKDGRALLQRLSHTPVPDVLFVDLSLPEISGRSLVEHVHAEPHGKDISIVLLSRSIPAPQNLPPQGSYHSVIMKPFLLSEIFSMMSQFSSKNEACLPLH
ncbi:MAG TPA: response regulator [Syntrophomonadaceae bacterium]|nr:response regulator [Syntrophomonadaceae bacterium]